MYKCKGNLRNACTKSGSLRFSIFQLLTDFVCLYTYEFWLSLCKIARSSVILLLPLFTLASCSTLHNFYYPLFFVDPIKCQRRGGATFLRRYIFINVVQWILQSLHLVSSSPNVWVKKLRKSSTLTVKVL
jgi:prepilin signal peptidase PulO-like enzyme (type II secretory pathway)